MSLQGRSRRKRSALWKDSPNDTSQQSSDASNELEIKAALLENPDVDTDASSKPKNGLRTSSGLNGQQPGRMEEELEQDDAPLSHHKATSTNVKAEDDDLASSSKSNGATFSDRQSSYGTNGTSQSTGKVGRPRRVRAPVEPEEAEEEEEDQEQDQEHEPDLEQDREEEDDESSSSGESQVVEFVHDENGRAISVSEVTNKIQEFETEFEKLRESYIQNQLVLVQHELDLISTNTHPDLKSRLDELEAIYERKINIASNRLKIETKHILMAHQALLYIASCENKGLEKDWIFAHQYVLSADLRKARESESIKREPLQSVHPNHLAFQQAP